MSDSKPRVLVADDERSIAEGLHAILSDEGYDVAVAEDGEAAWELLQKDEFGLVLADLNMPRLDGVSLLARMREHGIASQCIIVTGQATVGSAVEAMRIGAYDYIEKPLNAEKLNRLRALIEKALEKYAAERSILELTRRIEGLTHYGDITGQSEAMRAIYATIEAVAPSTASVLVLGESGTGKELVARALHSQSDRAKGPFLALNCAALPRDILENELFGHEKGAFTGSTNEKHGAFELAHGGTLFFDEVAEMAPEVQVKLLRALETRTIRRLGGKKEISVDIRIVAATNRDPQEALANSDLREDLYYRLAVVEIVLPPLRERGADIKLLAEEFLERFASANSRQLRGFDAEAMEWILSYGWPGNVRELKNAVERAVILSRGEQITRNDVVPRHIRSDVPGVIQLDAGATLAKARRKLVLQALASTGGDKERSARMLGIPRSEIDEELRALVAGASATAGTEVSEESSDAAAELH